VPVFGEDFAVARKKKTKKNLKTVDITEPTVFIFI
jgi:hypothetical protein